MDEKIGSDIEEAKEMLLEITEDRSIPRNIRSNVKEALDKIEEKKIEGLHLSSAIYLLDDISNDINMPSHARTTIWEAISMLESIKERIE